MQELSSWTLCQYGHEKRAEVCRSKESSQGLSLLLGLVFPWTSGIQTEYKLFVPGIVFTAADCKLKKHTSLYTVDF